MDPTVPRPRRGMPAADRRDEGLSLLRRLTTGAVIAALGGVGVLAGYVARAVPGHRVSPAPAATQTSQPSSSTAGLSPPAAPPQASGYTPQVISGSS